MSIRIVQSKQNARLKELRRALSNPGRNERGLVGIEGPNLIAEAVRSGLRVECIFVGEGIGVSQQEPLTAAADTDILLVPNLKSMLATETPQPIAALIEPPAWTWTHFLGDGQPSSTLIVVLAGVQDPGNLGTIVRSAEAFGADGVLCLPGTVSAWNSKAVRASAGSVFRLPILAATEEDAIARLREAGVKMIATIVDGAEPANLTNLTGPVALVIGNEGNGVPASLIEKADGAITIPCPGQVESLNAAVAASVLLYEASRQRALRSGGVQGKSAGPQARRGGIR